MKEIFDLYLENDVILPPFHYVLVNYTATLKTTTAMLRYSSRGRTTFLLPALPVSQILKL